MKKNLFILAVAGLALASCSTVMMKQLIAWLQVGLMRLVLDL